MNKREIYVLSVIFQIPAVSWTSADSTHASSWSCPFELDLEAPFLLQQRPL